MKRITRMDNLFDIKTDYGIDQIVIKKVYIPDIYICPLLRDIKWKERQPGGEVEEFWLNAPLEEWLNLRAVYVARNGKIKTRSINKPCGVRPVIEFNTSKMHLDNFNINEFVLGDFDYTTVGYNSTRKEAFAICNKVIGQCKYADFIQDCRNGYSNSFLKFYIDSWACAQFGLIANNNKV